MKKKILSLFKAISVRKTIIAISVAVVVTLALVGGLLAKYFSEKALGDNRVRAEDFYFTVDLLGETFDPASANRVIDLYGGSAQELSFKVRNFFDSARVTEAEIPYTVEMTETADYALGGDITLTEAGGGALQAGYSFTENGGSQEQGFVIHVPQGYAEGSEICVTVKSASPYIKTMTLTFRLHTFEHDVLYRVEDHGSYVELIVMTNVPIDSQRVIVDWSGINAEGNILKVDNTSRYVLDVDSLGTTVNPVPAAGYYSSIKVTSSLKANQSLSIVFMKNTVTDMYHTPEGVDIGVDKNAEGNYVVTLKQEGGYQ